MGDSATIEIPRDWSMISVVSNASPLINLARIGQLQILTALFETIRIPDAVYDEVVVQGAGQPGAEEVGNAAWIEKQSVANLNLVRALRCSRRCL